LLPALIHIDGKMTADKKHSGLNVFIMVPTKKSALEIRKKVQKYSYHDIKA
jgi:superfamily II DNA/RNA helicase